MTTTRQRVLICMAGFILLALMFFIVFSEHGLADLNGLKKERGWLADRNAVLDRDNRSLSVEIDRLKNDPAYIEQIARRKLGMIEPEERIVKFDRLQKDQP